MINCREI